MATRISHQTSGPLWKPQKAAKTPKPIMSAGKVAASWAKRKAKFYADHPPNHQGMYTCAICFKRIYKEDSDVDHIINRSLRPDLRFEESNLQITCKGCNVAKKLHKPKL